MTYTINSNLKEFVEVDPAKLEKFLAQDSEHLLMKLGFTATKVGKLFNVNPLYIVAHAILESAWGTSNLAKLKNNLFGYGASDDAPFEKAFKFPTQECCVVFVMYKVVTNYLTPAGKFWGDEPSLWGMNKMYASDKGWADKICKIMNNIDKFLTKEG